MITSQLRKAAARRGIKNAYQLQKAADFPVGQAYRLWNDNWQQLNLRTLNKLCNALQCTPNDLLFYTPDKDS
jgi:DNA-binding Xre family transcriptional regulator